MCLPYSLFRAAPLASFSPAVGILQSLAPTMAKVSGNRHRLSTIQHHHSTPDKQELTTTTDSNTRQSTVSTRQPQPTANNYHRQTKKTNTRQQKNVKRKCEHSSILMEIRKHGPDNNFFSLIFTRIFSLLILFS
jgi:hypothetical protein